LPEEQIRRKTETGDLLHRPSREVLHSPSSHTIPLFADIEKKVTFELLLYNFNPAENIMLLVIHFLGLYNKFKTNDLSVLFLGCLATDLGQEIV